MVRDVQEEREKHTTTVLRGTMTATASSAHDVRLTERSATPPPSKSDEGSSAARLVATIFRATKKLRLDTYTEKNTAIPLTGCWRSGARTHEPVRAMSCPCHRGLIEQTESQLRRSHRSLALQRHHQRK